MNDQQLKQRIAYLVEHGGLTEVDPLAEVERKVTRLTWLVGAALTLNAAQLAAHVL